MATKLAFFLAAIAAASASSSSSCAPTVSSSSTVALPASVSTQIDLAESVAANVVTIGTVISTAELRSQTLSYAESVIESYAHSYSSMISELESFYASPTEVSQSSVSSVTQLASVHSTLASAISEVVSFESSHPSFATAQRSIQEVEASQSSILTYLSELTYIASPSVETATSVLAQATITSPSILASVISILTAEVSYSTVASALSSLSSSLYSVPSTVVSEVLTIISSPSTAAPSVLSSISSCYPSVYSDLSYVTEFTKSHQSVVTAITNVLSVAATVSGLTSAAYTVITEQMPTLTYQLGVVARASYSWPSFQSDAQIISEYLATSPMLSDALSTIESSFYHSSCAASDIYDALKSPSSVQCPSQLSYKEISHQSLVEALDDVLSWEQAYPSYAAQFSSILQKMTSDFKTDRTLLTAASYVSSVVSPSVASALAAISSAKTVVSDITDVLSAIASATADDSTLACAESSIGYYAEHYPTAVAEIWHVDTASITYSSIGYYSQVEDYYPTLASDLSDVYSCFAYYPSFDSYEESFIEAASSDSYLLGQYNLYSEDIEPLSSSEYASSYDNGYSIYFP